jgi:hypothetical protein
VRYAVARRERTIVSKPRQWLFPLATQRECQGHAARGSRRRLVKACEVGVRIDVDQAGRVRIGPPQTEQRAQHDAAVATQQKYELPVASAAGYALCERARERHDVLLIATTSRRPVQVEVARRRVDIAEVPRTNSSDQASVPECLRRKIKAPRLPVLVRNEADR